MALSPSQFFAIHVASNITPFILLLSLPEQESLTAVQNSQYVL